MTHNEACSPVPVWAVCSLATERRIAIGDERWSEKGGRKQDEKVGRRHVLTAATSITLRAERINRRCHVASRRLPPQTRCTIPVSHLHIKHGSHSYALTNDFQVPLASRRLFSFSFFPLTPRSEGDQNSLCDRPSYLHLPCFIPAVDCGGHLSAGLKVF